MSTDYNFLQEVIALMKDFDATAVSKQGYARNVNAFKQWIYDEIISKKKMPEEPDWQGKDQNRSPESVIATLINHMGRYAKTYSKAAMADSAFNTQDEFIYLINLKAYGSMSKMELLKRNIHEKPVGIQIINRLIKQGWVVQRSSKKDKRSKLIEITKGGLQILEKQMKKIRQASNIVSGDLSYPEKMQLIRLLNKLEKFHHPIYHENIESSQLLNHVKNNYLSQVN
ncbi:MAG: helix-turn-helix domain-containing protein [Chitinophagaceae bacterium]